MIVAIAPSTPGVVPVEEFREAADEATAVADFCGEYAPPLNVADWIGFDAGATVPAAPAGGWHYDSATPGLVQSLALAKQAKCKEIDTRTDELVGAGFTFGAKQFSLSLSAQLTLIGARLSKTDLTYPVEWNTIDDGDKHSIANFGELDTFFLTALGTVRAHLDSGTSLKDQCRAATTIAELDAVVDNR